VHAIHSPALACIEQPNRLSAINERVHITTITPSMKTSQTRHHLVPAALTALLLTAMVGCADRNVPADPATPPAPEPTAQSAAGEAWDKTKDVASDAYDSVKDATVSAANKLDRATYDERMAIKANLAEAGAKLDAEIAEWRSEGKTVTPETESKIATAKSEFNESLDDLGDATSAGWEAAKAKTAAAWAKLKAAYEEAKAS
jgi:hypothetical protein